jgi:hypothetical protein
MKIQFGTKRTPIDVFHTLVLGCVLFAIVWFNANLQYRLGESQESIVDSRGLNVTHISIYSYCELPYNDCLCTVLSNRSNTSEKCITNVQLVGSRILPLITFWLQIYLVRALFSLHTAHRRVIIYALWITSIFIFIIMTISIYWSSCFQVHITFILYCTGALLWFLSCHNQLINLDNESSASNRNITVTVHPSERPNQATRSWQELL